MKIMLTDDVGNIHSVDVDQDMELVNLKALIENEMKVPIPNQIVLFNGNQLSNDGASLKSCGIRHDDILLIKSKVSTNDRPSEAENARQMINSDLNTRNRIIQQYPGIEAALQDPVQFERFFNEMKRQAQIQQQRILAEEQALNSADPFDVEAQKKIEEAIRKQNIIKSRENALEHHPESFGRVVMLYINVEVNGHKVKAFVDSGAQMTIMSPDCATACNLMHQLDEAFAGVAVGVGTAKLLGRIHSADLKIGKLFLPCSLTVMEGKDVDMLLGLDMLKRYQAVIDLKHNCLRIQDENVTFLPEHELPEKAKEKKLEPAERSAPAKPLETPQPAPQAVGPSSSSSKYPEESIKVLLDMGASREEALNALQAAEGNVELAVSILF